MTDYNLWKQFKEGDLGAYSQIYKKYFFTLYSYGKKLNDDHDLVKDCIQELFIKIWDNRENLNETTSIKYYLYTSLKRKLLDHLRTPDQKYRIEGEVPDSEVFMEEYFDEESFDINKEKVMRALSRLSAHQQKLLQLKYYQNLSNSEISESLGITVQSVYNAVFKALKSLRKKYII
jgi:RNA polymerase sigma factor (sigma-70 family)